MMGKANVVHIHLAMMHCGVVDMMAQWGNSLYYCVDYRKSKGNVVDIYLGCSGMVNVDVMSTDDQDSVSQ